MEEECSIGDSLAFKGEWLQAEASLSRSFIIYFYPKDNAVEMFDCRTRKTFMRRTKVPDLVESHFYIGSKVNIFGRQIDIVDYANVQTRKLFTEKRQKAFCLIKPDAIDRMGDIISDLTDNKFQIISCRMILLSNLEANQFVCDSKKIDLIEHLTTGQLLAIELISSNALEKLGRLAGPENFSTCREMWPNSLKSKYGTDCVRDAVYVSRTDYDLQRDLHFFLSNIIQSSAILKGSCLGIIKPHAIREGKLGSMLNGIRDACFTVSALQMFQLNQTNCEEFLEIYKGVVPEFSKIVSELISGPCVAIEVLAKKRCQNLHEEFRKFCGPSDPEIGRCLRPSTLRANFGINKVQNAIHCTDLEEDCQMDVEYFFKILQ